MILKDDMTKRKVSGPLMEDLPEWRAKSPHCIALTYISW